ncbi:hypothetical protein PU629_19105 [Pullulanibacillus sp. KACC 23026]|uniref:hypothetical protein n=1 Tax=Pullulanibacillus sp. KACC 23026 TaxID=3028315 RepID=UPI0023B10259|nr:hypothetical protein [Pullulanibacillus sp. KACC 23026]WEG12203.1 hypothetical protein PU629_19105 [Pullulanibacillus sp. KACC 23026]
MDEQLHLLVQRLELAQQDFNYAEPGHVDRAIDHLGAAEMELALYLQETRLSHEA